MNSAALPVRRSPHIVDVLIAERAPRLTASPVWPVVRPALYSVLNYRAAVRMADAIQNLSGAETLDHVSDLLSLKVSTAHLEGDITAEQLSIDVGAYFQGRVTQAQRPAAVAAPTPAPVSGPVVTPVLTTPAVQSAPAPVPAE